VLNIESNDIDDIFQRIIKNPELIFGIVGPIGVDLDSVVSSLEKSLSEVNYKSRVIHITKLIKNDKIDVSIDESSYSKRYRGLIEYGNRYRELAETKAAFAGVAISKIRDIRQEIAPRDPDKKETTGDPAFGFD
jgi:hypothetical protein